MSSIIGIDLGGTKIAAARYNSKTFEAEETIRESTPQTKSFEDVFDKLTEVIDKLKTEDTKSIGIGVPGMVAHPEGVIVSLPNINGAEDFPLKAKFEEKTSMEASIGNDVNCFTLAEALYGAGKKESVVVGVTMGTGVGGGIVIDGKLFRGANGFAAEIGHMLLKPGEPPYDCDDKRGDVEQFLSGTAMGKRCEAAKKPEDYLEGEVCEFMQPEIIKEVAWICASLTHLLDPSVIVFGGSAGRALESHLSDIEKELNDWTLEKFKLPKLLVAQLKDAGTRGAALLTMQ